MSLKLLPINPHFHTCCGGMPAPDLCPCTPHAQDGCCVTNLLCPHQEPSCSPPQPRLPIHAAVPGILLFQVLVYRLPPNVKLLSWRTQCPPSKVRSHLPVDQLANIALPLLDKLSRPPFASGHLLPDGFLILRGHHAGSISCPQGQGQVPSIGRLEEVILHRMILHLPTVDYASPVHGPG